MTPICQGTHSKHHGIAPHPHYHQTGMRVGELVTLRKAKSQNNLLSTNIVLITLQYFIQCWRILHIKNWKCILKPKFIFLLEAHHVLLPQSIHFPHVLTSERFCTKKAYTVTRWVIDQTPVILILVIFQKYMYKIFLCLLIFKFFNVGHRTLKSWTICALGVKTCV